MSKIITNESFLNEIQDLINPDIEIIGKYIKSTQKILCKCKICGHQWGMLPGNIRKGRGCPKCMYKKSEKTKNSKSKDRLFSFVQENCSFKIIGDYVNSTTKVECECSICGHHWAPLPSNILKGQGCPKCGRKACSQKLSFSQKEIIKQLPDSIELLQYTRAGELALFRCKICSHEWFYIPSNLISKNRGCPICNGYLKTNSVFIEQLQQINSNIEVLEPYINSTTKLKCRCKKCGALWKSDPHHLLSGKGCPCCDKSKGELTVQTILQKYNIPYTYQYYLKTDFGSKIFVDFKVELGGQLYFIEYNGIQHYQPIEYFGGIEQFQKQQRRDQYLKDYCNKNNIIFLELHYDMNNNDIEKILCDKLATAASRRMED